MVSSYIVEDQYQIFGILFVLDKMASAVSTASAGKLEPAWPTFRPAKPDPVLGIKLIYRVSQRDARFSKIKYS